MMRGDGPAISLTSANRPRPPNPKTHKSPLLYLRATQAWAARPQPGCLLLVAGCCFKFLLVASCAGPAATSVTRQAGWPCDGRYAALGRSKTLHAECCRHSGGVDGSSPSRRLHAVAWAALFRHQMPAPDTTGIREIQAGVLHRLLSLLTSQDICWRAGLETSLPLARLPDTMDQLTSRDLSCRQQIFSYPQTTVMTHAINGPSCLMAALPAACWGNSIMSRYELCILYSTKSGPFRLTPDTIGSRPSGDCSSYVASVPHAANHAIASWNTIFIQ